MKIVRRGLAGCSLCAGAFMWIACEAEQHHLEIVLDSYDGFACVEDQELLTCDIAGRGCMVLDVIDVPGLPNCRENSLIGACKDGSCAVVARALLDMSEVSCPCPGSGSGGPLEQGEAILDALNALLSASGPTLSDAPDGSVVVRLVATTQSCEELRQGNEPDLSARFEPVGVRGCAYSCPAILDDVDETIHLGLTGFPSSCNARAACACAVGFLDDGTCTAELFSEDGQHLADRPTRCE